MKSSLTLLLLILLLFLFGSGCDCSEGDMTSAFGPRCSDEEGIASSGSDGSDGTGSLLVSDVANLSIREFTGISTLDSSVDTGQSLTGGLTRLTRPQYLTIHPTNSDLIVADEGTSAILFFSDPTTIEGNVPPNRVLSGVNTELNGPVQTIVDSTNDELYVLDRGTSQVLVFSNASTIEGDVAPTRRLGGATSGLANPNSFFLRTSNEQISVLNPTEVLTFDGFRSINGDPAPAGRFSGPATTFNNLTFGTITSAGRFIAVDAGTDQLLSFDNFQFDAGNTAPTRIVGGGNTSLAEPRQFAISGDTIYIADSSQVLVFDSLSTIEGNPFPDRRFSGLNPGTQTLTGLVFP